MTNGVKDLRSLPLYDLIGGPLNAIVQAEAQAARTTLQFIERVGFVHPPAPEGEEPGEGQALEIGQLRMMEFSYTKPNERGEPAEFITRLPVLSILPIPGIRIKTATISFTAKITDVYQEEAESVQTSQTESATWLQGQSVQFRGGLVSTAGSRGTTQSAYDMNISVELEQLPITAGMEKLLALLEMAIHEETKQP